MYGLELVIIIVGTMLMIMSSNGERNSMQVGGWLITWRAVMGLGIGADYPLSAVITAEFAPRRHRARMLCWVFFAQPVGQLLANLLSLAAVEGFKSYLPSDRANCLDGPNSDECFKALDRLWRLVVGLGIVPAVIALAFRFTIPESPRYKLDILRNVQNVFEDTKHYYGGLDAESNELETLPTTVPVTHREEASSRRSSLSSEIAPEEMVAESDSDSERRSSSIYAVQAARTVDISPGDPSYVPPLASLADAKEFFITQGNWQYLLGTSLSWLFLDFAFYGLGLNSPNIVRHIWPTTEDESDNDPILKVLRDTSLRSLVTVSLGACLGGALMIKVIRYVSPKRIQFYGFLALFVLFIVTGAAWKPLLKSSNRSGLVVLYVLSQVAFNLGPNVTTFIIPAEIFPTRYRCTCHGIAAASGKLGSWLVQIFLAYPPFQDKSPKGRLDNLGVVLLAMSAFMLAGAVVTWFLVPETREGGVKSRSLEVLACGKTVLDPINKKEKEEEERN